MRTLNQAIRTLKLLKVNNFVNNNMILCNEYSAWAFIHNKYYLVYKRYNMGSSDYCLPAVPEDPKYNARTWGYLLSNANYHVVLAGIKNALYRHLTGKIPNAGIKNFMVIQLKDCTDIDKLKEFRDHFDKHYNSYILTANNDHVILGISTKQINYLKPGGLYPFTIKKELRIKNDLHCHNWILMSNLKKKLKCDIYAGVGKGSVYFLRSDDIIIPKANEILSKLNTPNRVVYFEGSDLYDG